MPGAKPGRRSLADLALALILGLLCAALLHDAAGAPPSWFPGDIGVTAVPEGVTWCLAALAALLALQTALRWRDDRNGPWSARQAWSRFRQCGLPMFLTLLLLVAYVASLGLERPGFEVKSFAWLALTLWLLLGRRRWPQALAVSLVTVLTVTLVFTRLFAVPLP